VTGVNGAAVDDDSLVSSPHAAASNANANVRDRSAANRLLLVFTFVYLLQEPGTRLG
jgi:hypothetical protein